METKYKNTAGSQELQDEKRLAFFETLIFAW